MTMQTEVPTALEPQNPPDGAAPQAPPSEQGGDSTPVAATESARERELRIRLSQQGREAAEARRSAENAARANAELTTKVNELEATVKLVGATLSEREQREQQQYLNALPPDERLAYRLEQLERRLDQPPNRTDVPPARTATTRSAQPTNLEDEAAYMERRAQEILADVAKTTGIQLTGSEDDIDWTTEDTFRASALTIGKVLARGRASLEGRTQGDSAVAAKKPETPQEMEARITANVMRNMGVSSPNSPRPAARQGKPNEEDVRTTVSTYDSRQGPKASLAKLKALREKM